MTGQGKAQVSVLALAALLGSLIASPVLAQSQPQNAHPNPSPSAPLSIAPAKPKAQPEASGGVAATPANPAAPVPPAQVGTPAQAKAQTQPPNPISNPFAVLLGKPGNTVAFDRNQRAIIKRVDNYLSTVQTLEGNFVQVGPNGHRSTGEFFLQKPGKVRFEYDPPSPVEIIADGESVVVRDRKLATQDLYPLSQTPLRFLLADHVNLLKNANLVAVYADDVFVTVVVEEKNPVVGTSRLMVMFSAKDMQLKQWTVTDPQGFDTTVAVYNLDTTDKPDPSLFKIDYTNYHN